MIKEQTRFGAIHGMRGIAAMAVVLFHLSGNLKPELQEFLPNVMNIIFSYGYLGVPIFFVISGFVISYSISFSRVTAKYAGNFILRRSIRLDLTYWASIAFALTLLAIKNAMLESNEAMPSFTDVLLNMFYLQELMKVEPVISVVYWTLCLEVQFYLFFIFSLWVSQKISVTNCIFINLFIIISVGVYSILLNSGAAENHIKALFFSNWHYFLMGILVSNVVRGLPYSSYIFFLWLLTEFVFLYGLEFKAYTITGICCSAAIWIMFKLNLLDRLFTGKILTYLGTISYTLYLVHPDIGWKVISFGKAILGGSLMPWQAGILLLAGIITSVIVAHIFHIIFEKPTQKIASRLKHEPLSFVLKDTFKLNK